LCYDNPLCSGEAGDSTEDVLTLILDGLHMAGYDASTNGKIIGIAKDGHVIYGPKDSNGD